MNEKTGDQDQSSMRWLYGRRVTSPDRIFQMLCRFSDSFDLLLITKKTPIRTRILADISPEIHDLVFLGDILSLLL